MNTPSVKSIMQITRVTAEQAKLAKFAFNATLDEIEEKFPVTAAWMRTCYHAPTRIHAMMNACDEAIGTYGIESTEGRNGRSLKYCNTGDSYAATICFEFKQGFFGRKLSRVFVGCWGDWVEKHGKREVAA